MSEDQWEKRKDFVDREQRVHARAELRMRVLVMSGNKFHGSYTRDISLGGFLLEEPIPWLKEETACQIFIFAEDKRNNVEFRARILSHPQDPLRIAFQNVDERRKKVLQDWIEAALNQGSDQFKKAA